MGKNYFNSIPWREALLQRLPDEKARQRAHSQGGCAKNQIREPFFHRSNNLPEAKSAVRLPSLFYRCRSAKHAAIRP